MSVLNGNTRYSAWDGEPLWGWLRQEFSGVHWARVKPPPLFFAPLPMFARGFLPALLALVVVSADVIWEYTLPSVSPMITFRPHGRPTAGVLDGTE